MAKADLTAARLRELLHYDPQTGQFTWLVLASKAWVKPGATAGFIDSEGYGKIKVDGRQYRSHRLAWLFTHGRWPEGILDHVNRDKADNRIDNLREVTRAQNAQNVLSNKNNTSGYKGVSRKKKRWAAGITKDRRRISLGTFGTAQEAASAYIHAAQSVHSINPVTELRHLASRKLPSGC